MTRRSAIDTELADIDKELSAIAAYEAAKTGKAPTPRRSARTRTRTPGRRDAVLALVQRFPDGIKRKDILEHMGVKNDKSGEQSVSNALSALVKAKKLGLDAGIYRAA
jgi:hypothetical protein